MALAFLPEVLGAAVEAEDALDEELELAADEEAALLLEEELLEAAALDEPADEALPFKQEASLLAWIGTWEE